MWVERKEYDDIVAKLSRADTAFEMIFNEIKQLRALYDTNQKCDTKIISGVTLEELAKLYLDGTPIEREERVFVKYFKQ